MNPLFALVPLPYRWLIGALLVAAVWGHGWMKGAQHGEARLAVFTQAQAVEAGKAQALADARAAADRQRKDASDASYRTAIGRLSADIGRMRDASAGPYIVPAAAPAPGSADRACFNRAELDGAIRRFAEGAAGLVAEGATARLKLDEAIRWAK